MIVEIARIKIKPGSEAAFEDALRFVAGAFQRAKGCHGAELRRSLEQPGIYYAVVRWDSVEHHMVEFRNSADGVEWTRLSRPCFDGAPVFDHTELVAEAR